MSEDSLVIMRPYFALFLLLLIPIVFFSWRQMAQSNQWQKIVDAHLLKFLMEKGDTSRSKKPLLVLITAFLLAIIALIGPSFQKVEVPVFTSGEARVILLDLSFSMDAMDIKPSRLTRAKHKLSDILSASNDGETALIVYAGDAFVISPLTSDSNTIESMINVLSTRIMPLFGSEPYLAFDKAIELLENAGKAHGTIIWLTDGIDDTDIENIESSIEGRDLTIKILAIGTEQGAPIPLPNNKGFLKDSSGEIVMPALSKTQLERFKQKTGAEYTLLTADNTDVNFVTQLDRSLSNEFEKEDDQKNIESQQDQGFWIVLLILPFALMLFRKNTTIPGISLCLLFTMYAPPNHAGLWDDLWSTPNQQAQKAFEKEEFKNATELFKNEQWKASAAYKAGDHKTAAELFSTSDTATSHYNRGNALAKNQQLDEAIEAYTKALERDPNHEDAKHNKAIVEQLKQQKDEQDKKDQEKQDQENDEKNQDSEQNQESDDSQESDSEEKNSEEQSKDQQEQQEQKEAEANEQNKNEEELTEEQKRQQQMELTDEREQKEKDQALEQWLRKLQDDPGGLLRRKMNNEYKKRGRQNRYTKKVW